MAVAKKVARIAGVNPQNIASAMDSLDPNVKVDLAAKKDGEYTIINAILPQLHDWRVQAGATGTNATDSNNRGAFMLGGTNADILTGGTAADLLIGNAGNDTLTGGIGSERLLVKSQHVVYQENTALKPALAAMYAAINDARYECERRAA